MVWRDCGPTCGFGVCPNWVELGENELTSAYPPLIFNPIKLVVLELPELICITLLSPNPFSSHWFARSRHWIDIGILIAIAEPSLTDDDGAKAVPP